MSKTPILVIALTLIVGIIGCGSPTPSASSGILTIDGYGAMYIGSRVTGEIDGHEYLFVNLNTEGSEPHAIPGILVLDVKNPGNPKEVGYLQAPEETLYIASLAISGTTLYVCAADFLWMVDVSRPAKPEEITTFTDVNPIRMAVSGYHAYVNDGNRQITVIDITQPDDLRIVGSLQMVSLSGISLNVYETVLYAKTSQELHVIDITSPDTLKEINTITITSGDSPDGDSAYYLRQFTISGKYAYVVLASEDEHAIAVLDLSDPVNPREINRFEPENSLFGADLFVSGNKLYLITRSFASRIRNSQDLLDIYDLSEPDNPVLLDSYYLPDFEEYFSTFHSSVVSGYRLVGRHLYRFIGNAPNDPVIATINLSNW